MKLDLNISGSIATPDKESFHWFEIAKLSSWGELQDSLFEKSYVDAKLAAMGFLQALQRVGDLHSLEPWRGDGGVKNWHLL